jgi:hypothetical protein
MMDVVLWAGKVPHDQVCSRGRHVWHWLAGGGAWTHMSGNGTGTVSHFGE